MITFGGPGDCFQPPGFPGIYFHNLGMSHDIPPICQDLLLGSRFLYRQKIHQTGGFPVPGVVHLVIQQVQAAIRLLFPILASIAAFLYAYQSCCFYHALSSSFRYLNGIYRKTAGQLVRRSVHLYIKTCQQKIIHTRYWLSGKKYAIMI